MPFPNITNALNLLNGMPEQEIFFPFKPRRVLDCLGQILKTRTSTTFMQAMYTLYWIEREHWLSRSYSLFGGKPFRLPEGIVIKDAIDSFDAGHFFPWFKVENGNLAVKKFPDGGTLSIDSRDFITLSAKKLDSVKFSELPEFVSWSVNGTIPLTHIIQHFPGATRPFESAKEEITLDLYFGEQYKLPKIESD